MSTEPRTPGDPAGAQPDSPSQDSAEQARAAAEEAREAAEEARNAAEEAREAAAEAKRRHDADDARADEWEEESFPASDPPSNY
jgi:predicted ribosome quality control (RQC) complex YloA/Tae2 family protein